MIIAIDGNEANVLNRVGVGYYAYNLLQALYMEDKTNTYWIYLKEKPNKDMPPKSKNWEYIVFGPKKFWTRIALPLKLYSQLKKPDIFISPSHYTPFLCPIPKLVTIMDLGYLDNPEQFTKKDYYQLKNWTEHSLRTSQHILTISNFCKQDIIQKYRIDSEKISVLYPIVSTPPKDILKPNNLDYFLYLGTLKPSKNIPFLINAYSKLKTKTKLVIAGKKGWLYDEIYALVKKLKIENKVEFTGYIDEAIKWSLLKYAKALIIPSLFEGFGIPVVEAMHFNTPVISSNRGSLTEINGTYGQTIDPKNEEELIYAMKNIKKIKNGFPRKYTQKNIVAHFSSIIKNVSRQVRK